MGAEYSKYDSLSVTSHYADTRLPCLDDNQATVRCAIGWEAYIELPNGGPRLCKLEAVSQSSSRSIVFAGPKIVDRADPGPVLKIKAHWGGAASTIRLVIASTKGLPTVVATGHVKESDSMYLFLGEEAPDKRQTVDESKIELMAKVYGGGNEVIVRIALGMDELVVAVAWALMCMIRATVW